MDKRFVVLPSRNGGHQFGVFEELMYESGPRKIGDEVATHNSERAAQLECEKRNSEIE
jgi:hypothetical protein